MREDYIDFPCSDDWLDHYHRMGLTPRHSGRMDPEVKELLREIAELRRAQAEMLEILLEVVKTLKGRSSQTKHSDLDKFNDLGHKGGIYR